MILLPIITREMRAAARQPFTYYVRMGGAGVALVISILYGLDGHLEAGMGGPWFSMLHLALNLCIWLLVPLLCADCISRERREGTLGLLFLTGLKGGEIVAAKGAAHGLRALALWLGVLPLMTIPVLLGGVGINQVVLSVMGDFCTLCWALSAGLLASAASKTWIGASLSSIALSLFFLEVLLVACGLVIGVGISPGAWDARLLVELPAAVALQFGFVPASRVFAFRTLSGMTSWRLLADMGAVCILSLLALVLVVAFAGRRARRVWQDRPPSPRQMWLRRTFLTPVVWKDFFRRWLSRRLERNPIGWLEQRTWNGRMVTWGWFAVVVSLFSVILTDRNFFRDFEGWLDCLGWTLAGSLAFTTAGSFRREREAGVMELLLVSPLQEKTIILGRLRGIWGQFLPSMGLMLGLWLYFMSFLQHDDRESWLLVSFFVGVFVTLPIVGLYFSLRCRNYLVAFAAAISVGCLLPFVGTSLVLWLVSVFLFWTEVPMEASLVLVAVFQALTAAYFGRKLFRMMRLRAFPLQRALS
jgi:ABC-type transport system involved in multi-copper enzyme maturation permease subunit